MESKGEAPKKAVIYTRVSTDEQVGGHLLAAQYEACFHFIKARGWEFLEEYREEGQSGKNLNRPQIQRLVSDAKNRKFQMVVAYKLDRISRDIKDFHGLWTTFEDHGIDFSTPTQMIDTSTSSGKLMINILLSFAQFEREQITERSVMGTEQRVVKDKKWRGGRAPFGYQSDKNLKTIVPLESEARTVRAIFEDYRSGIAKADIANSLNLKGVKKRSQASFNRGQFTFKNVDEILNQPAYWGYQIYRKEYLPSDHKPILATGLCEKLHEEYLQKIADRTSKTLRSRRQKEKNKHGILFHGLLFDGDTGESMVVEQAKGNTYFYYVSGEKRKLKDGNPLRVQVDEIEAVVLEALDCLSSNSDVLHRVERALNEHRTLRLREIDGQLAELRKNRKAVTAEVLGAAKTRTDSKGNAKVVSELAKHLDSLDAHLRDIDGKIERFELESKQISTQLIDVIRLSSEGSLYLRALKGLESHQRPLLAQLFIKRIEIKRLSAPPVESPTGGFINERQEIVFRSKRKDAKRTSWISMKFELRQGVDFSGIFTEEAKVRFQKRLAFPRGFEPLYPP